MKSDAKEAVASLVECAEEIKIIEEWFAYEHKETWDRYLELKAAKPNLVDQAKTALRKTGSADLFGHHFNVGKCTTTVVDSAGILDKAEERGDVQVLLEYGVLKHTVIAKQLDRLPGDLKAIYTGYVEKKAATSAVSIPKILQ